MDGGATLGVLIFVGWWILSGDEKDKNPRKKPVEKGGLFDKSTDRKHCGVKMDITPKLGYLEYTCPKCGKKHNEA